LDLPDPEVSEPQQLLIGVQAARIRNRDDVVRAGNWDVCSTPPMALGVEAAGNILAIGPGVTRSISNFVLPSAEEVRAAFDQLTD